MIKRFLKNYGIFMIFCAAVAVAFIFGLVLGMYGKSAPSLAVAEGYGDSSAVIADVESVETEVSEVSETVEVTNVSEISTAGQSKSLGIFKITAYCPCERCSGEWGTRTSTGATATEGRTIAVDPSVIPYGTEVVINGKSYIAEDTGGAIKGNKMDIYFDSHEAAESYGVQYVEVFLK